MSIEQSVSNPSESPEEPSSTDPTTTQQESTVSPVVSTDASSPQDASDQDVQKPGRRVQLNPTGQFTAIPSREGNLTATSKSVRVSAESEPSDSADGGGGDAVEIAKPKGAAATPIEIPQEIGDLDKDLEAEIEAALSSVEQATSTLQAEVDQATSEAQTPDTTLAEDPEVGERRKGIVQSVHGDNVFLDLGIRSPGVVPVRQFQTVKPPAVGQQLQIVVDSVNQEEGLILVSLPSGRQRLTGSWEDVAVGQVVDCMVTKTNKGGLEVNVSNLRGFLPAGQLDFNYVADLEPYVGQKLTVKIIEVKREKRNLVVSRRAYLEIERLETEQQRWLTLAEGQVLSGTVKTIKNYGAFVDVGGVDGFLHIGQVSWSRIGHPSEVLQEGQSIDVKVLKLDRENKKISLGMKQLSQDPWMTAGDRYAVGTTVSGTVTRAKDFGAFVQLEPGVEGMIHVSELDYRHIKKVTDVLSVGQEIDVQVLDVNPERKRIALSLKAMMTKPVEETPEPAVIEDEKVPKPTTESLNKNLKGGIGRSGSGSGLFGNPRDFS